MRNLGLDIIRTVAVLLVLGRHLHVPEGILPPVIESAIGCWKRGGWVGVDLFFVLSGFLVSGLLFKEHQQHGTVSIRRFLVRRGFKIYPAFWALLLFSIPVKYLVGGDRPSGEMILGEIFFLQNYVGALWNHTWTLAVEEHFYIAFALLASLLIAKSPRRNFAALPSIFLAIATLCLVFRIYTVSTQSEFTCWRVLYPTHLRIDSLFFGVLLSYLCHYHQLLKWIGTRRAWALTAAGLLLLSPAFIKDVETNPWVSVQGVILFYIGSGMLVLASTRLQDARFRVLKWPGALGAASYSVYLWHMPVNRAAERLFPDPTAIQYLIYISLYFCGSIVVGVVLGRLIEAPVLRIRDRLFPSLVGPRTAPPTNLKPTLVC